MALRKQRPLAGVIEAIAGAEAIILCPSNPFISIGPILAFRGIREALQRRRDRVAAISPIVGGRALKGPAAHMMKSMRLRPAAAEVAQLYADFAGVFVLDEVDRKAGRPSGSAWDAARGDQHRHARPAGEKISGASGCSRIGDRRVIFAVLPVKSPQNAKQRLSGFLLCCAARNAGSDFVQADACGTVPGRRASIKWPWPPAIPTSPNTPAARARWSLMRTSKLSHSVSADAACLRAIELGATTVLLVPIDVPLVTSDDFSPACRPRRGPE